LSELLLKMGQSHQIITAFRLMHVLFQAFELGFNPAPL